jgi:hypothetical protein
MNYDDDNNDDTKNEVEKKTGNPFVAYGSAAASRNIGLLVKFSHGVYTIGPSAEDLPPNSIAIADMDLLAAGWIKWEDGRPVEQQMGLVSERFQPPRRRDLGDLDQDNWERGDNGRPRDPWTFSNSLPLVLNADKQVGTFVTSSMGGLDTIAKLCSAYGKQMVQRENDFPVVELGCGSYQHRDKAVGRVRFPILKILDWTPKAPIIQLVAEAGEDEQDGDETPPPAALPAKATPKRRK